MENFAKRNRRRLPDLNNGGGEEVMTFEALERLSSECAVVADMMDAYDEVREAMIVVDGNMSHVLCGKLPGVLMHEHDDYCSVVIANLKTLIERLVAFSIFEEEARCPF